MRGVLFYIKFLIKKETPIVKVDVPFFVPVIDSLNGQIILLADYSIPLGTSFSQ
jgi:hypothetical protein